MPDYKEILYEKKRRGALITLNRPEAMNAISRNMIKSCTTLWTKSRKIGKFARSS